MKKYAVHPGWCRDKFSGKFVFVSFRELLLLYGINKRECYDYSNHNELIENIDKKPQIHLFPRADGQYAYARYQMKSKGIIPWTDKREGSDSLFKIRIKAWNDGGGKRFCVGDCDLTKKEDSFEICRKNKTIAAHENFEDAFNEFEKLLKQEKENENKRQKPFHY